ncbi:MAG: sulfotransferase domain-containing protein [Thiohalorhabdus sp.]|uniref:sulfotransferase domain-containing protein n=1 Tax=Thiohalorhabdus sp. TaxID=3094134 RepID=UPI0039805D52
MSDAPHPDREPGRSAPTFLVIGGQKCGTTWLAEMVAQHPEVATPGRKELHFFDVPASAATGREGYCRQFPEPGPGERAVGEFTPDYLYATEPAGGRSVAGQVRKWFPEIRLVVCLRDPVERALSALHHHQRKGRVPAGTDPFTAPPELGILDKGRYADHLAPWLEHFPREQLLVLFHEREMADEHKAETMRRVFTHLGVDPDFLPAHLYQRYNARRDDPATWLSRLPLVGNHPGLWHPLVGALARLRRELPGVTATTRRDLAAYYREPNRALARLLQAEPPWPEAADETASGAAQ